MRQENIETKNLRAKMAIGYILILLLVGGNIFWEEWGTHAEAALF